VSESNKDEFLLERAKGGDRDAFLQLYQRHRNPVFHFLYRLLGSVSIAEDLAHDSFMRLIGESESSHSLPMVSVRTRLYSNARTLAMDYFQNSDEQLRVKKDVNKSDAISSGDKPSNKTQDGRLASTVEEAVASLPTLEREALILYDYEGLKLDEIATIVGADVGKVASRLGSARQRLQKVLADDLRREH
jgi:RNA polymerase sigma-70 factor, ECF subfamily